MAPYLSLQNSSEDKILFNALQCGALLFTNKINQLNMLFETQRLKAIQYSIEKLDEIYCIYQDTDIIKYTTVDGKPKSKEQLLKGIEAYNAMYPECSMLRASGSLLKKHPIRQLATWAFFILMKLKVQNSHMHCLQNIAVRAMVPRH